MRAGKKLQTRFGSPSSPAASGVSETTVKGSSKTGFADPTDAAAVEIGTLTDLEKDCFYAYKGTAYERVNRVLRGQTAPETVEPINIHDQKITIQDYIDHLDAGFRKVAAMDEDVVVFRGERHNKDTQQVVDRLLSQAQAAFDDPNNNTFSFGTYTSTSTDEAKAMGFCGDLYDCAMGKNGIRYQIHIAKGSKAVSYDQIKVNNHNESEFLLSRHQKYKVSGIRQIHAAEIQAEAAAHGKPAHQVGKLYVIDLEVIPEKPVVSDTSATKVVPQRAIIETKPVVTELSAKWDKYKPHLLGETTVIDRLTQQPIRAFLIDSQISDRQGIMLLIEQNGEPLCIGDLHMSPANLSYASELPGYYTNALKVRMLASSQGDKYRGVGTQLMQAAIEQSFKQGYEGRIVLDAVNDIPFNTYRPNDTPVPFYSKLGFQMTNTIDDARLSEAMSTLQTKGRYTGPWSGDMHLPNDQILIWEQKINQSPIF